MASPEPAEEQARLYMKMGPAARLIGTKSPDPVTLEAVAADLVSELRNHQTNVGIALGAMVHYVSASA